MAAIMKSALLSCALSIMALAAHGAPGPSQPIYGFKIESAQAAKVSAISFRTCSSLRPERAGT